MNRLGQFAAACAAVLCAFGANAVEQVAPGTGDDAAAINAAIATAAGEGGDGVVQLADGTYNLTAPVVLDAAVELRGNDADRSKVIVQSGKKSQLIQVKAEGALVHGITFQNGTAPNQNPYCFGPVYVTAGVVSNCVVQNCSAGYCPGVGMTDTGKIYDSYISGCSTSDGGDAGIGGGLRLYGSGNVARGCTIVNNSSNRGGGAYVKASGAQLLDCTISGNTSSGNGGGVFVDGGGIVSNCVIRANTSTGGNGGGVYFNGNGRVQDCPITGNKATNGGGVYMGNGSLLGCTVAGNEATSLYPGVYQSGGTIKNCIIWNNGPLSALLPNEKSLVFVGGTCAYTCAAGAPSEQAGNIVDRLPLFRDPAQGDWSLDVGSPCIGAGEGGVDMGVFPYEAHATPACTFSYRFVDGVAPQQATFTAHVVGGTATAYSWDFGDGSAADTTSGATATHNFEDPGTYAVTLTVTLEGGAPLTYVVEKAVNLGGSVAYVSHGGSKTFPYATPETATDDIQAAIDVVIASDAQPGVVRVAASETPYTRAGHDRFIIDRPVEVVGDGRDTTTVDGNGGSVGIFLLKHDKAAVRNLTMWRGYWSGRSNDCGSFNLEKGLVSNCYVKACKGFYSGAARVSGGKCYDLVVAEGNESDSGGAGKGGGVYQTAGWLENCVISNCTASSNGAGLYASSGTATNVMVVGCKTTSGEGRGGGLYVCGATVYDAVVTDCKMSKDGGIGGGGVYISSGTIDGLVVSNCSATYKSGGGVYLAGGTVKNAIISGNSAGENGGGILMTSGTLDHATVARNNAVTSGSGVQLSGGTITSTIIAGNGNQTGASGQQLNKTGGTVRYSCAAELEDADGNISADPKFRAPAEDDFRLLSSSPCRDCAEDGSDMGAIPYVYDPSAVVVALLVQTSGPTCPVDAVFTVDVDGVPPAPIAKYVWSFGDGGTVETATNAIDHVYADCGVFDVSVALQFEDGTLWKTVTNEKAVSVYSDVAYVDVANENPQLPYDTLEKAANTVEAALDVIYVPTDHPATIYVKAGTYPLAASTTWTLKRNVQIKSLSGERDVLVSCKGKAFRIEMNASDALVSGVVVSNTPVFYGIWGVFDTAAGTVTNCAAIKCGSGGYGGGAYAGSKAKFYDCLFDTCSSSDGNGGGKHGLGGALVEGGTMVRCVFTNCTAGSNAGGVQMSSGKLSGCVIANCTGRGRALYMTGGTAENCQVLNNTDNGNGGECIGIYATAGTVRNCLVAGNTSTKVAAGIRATGTATVESCTIAGNSGTTAGIISGNDAKWYNVLSWGNVGVDSYGAATLDHCLVGVDPNFRNPARGNYRIKSGSPAQNAGTNQSWMDGATDLQGNPRILNKTVDIGCYEVPVTGLTLIVR